MKLLNLIIYSTNIPEYQEMYKIQSAYLKKIGIEHYFLVFSSNIKEFFGSEQPVIIYDNIIYFEGKETLIPGILLKTLYGFELFKHKNYDYILRSNISEIVNFDLLQEKLNEMDFDYGGSQYKELTWLDYRAGIFDWQYYKQPFIQGNAILISNNFRDLILEHKIKMLNYNVIDDVSFGLLYYDLKQKYNLKDVAVFKEVINVDKYEKDAVFYRNKHEDRKIDVKNMKKICDELYQIHKDNL